MIICLWGMCIGSPKNEALVSAKQYSDVDAQGRERSVINTSNNRILVPFHVQTPFLL